MAMATDSAAIIMDTEAITTDTDPLIMDTEAIVMDTVLMIMVSRATITDLAVMTMVVTEAITMHSGEIPILVAIITMLAIIIIIAKIMAINSVTVNVKRKSTAAVNMVTDILIRMTIKANTLATGTINIIMVGMAIMAGMVIDIVARPLFKFQPNHPWYVPNTAK